MMWPLIAGLFAGANAPALIGAAATLGGAALSKPKTSYQVPDYAGIRAAAEAAGFNPLTALQAAPGAVVQTSNPMGQAFADAGLMLADSVAKNRTSNTVQRLRAQNDALQKRVTRMTLQPTVPGVYARRSAAGGGGAANASVAGAGAGSGGAARGGSGRADVDLAASDSGTAPATKPLSFFGYPIRPSSQTSDADVWASRYGEDGGLLPAPSFFAGWGAFARDVTTTFGEDATAWVPDGRFDGLEASWERRKPPTAAETRALWRRWNPHREAGVATRRFDPNHRDGYYLSVSPGVKPYVPSDYWRAPKRSDWPSFQLGRD